MGRFPFRKGIFQVIQTPDAKSALFPLSQILRATSSSIRAASLPTTLIYLCWKLKTLIDTAKVKAKTIAIPKTTAAETPTKSCLIP